MATFDPKQVLAIFGPVIFGDYAKGTFIKVATDGDDFTSEKGADGSYERINNNNNLLTVEISIKQTSPINAALSAIRIADKKANTGVFPFAITDLNGFTPAAPLCVIPKCFIKKAPDLNEADSLQSRTWILEGVGELFIDGNK